MFDRLDLLAQFGQRATAYAAQDFGVTPLALRPAGPEFSFNHTSAQGETRQGLGYDSDTEGVAAANVAGREWPVRPCIAEDEVADRVRHGLEVALRQFSGERCAEGVSITTGILDGDDSLLAGNRDLDDSTLFPQQANRVIQNADGRVQTRSSLELAERKIAEPKQEIVDGVDRLRLMARVEALKLELRLFERSNIEQFAQLRFTQKIAELRLIDRKRLRATLRQRRIAVVDEVGDIAE